MATDWLAAMAMNGPEKTAKILEGQHSLILCFRAALKNISDTTIAGYDGPSCVSIARDALDHDDHAPGGEHE